MLKNEDFGFQIFEKDEMLRPFKLKKCSKRFKGKLCFCRGIVETIFNIGYGSVQPPMVQRVKECVQHAPVYRSYKITC